MSIHTILYELTFRVPQLLFRVPDEPCALTLTIYLLIPVRMNTIELNGMNSNEKWNK